MKPFDRYPEEGEVLILKAPLGNTRHCYGLALQRLTEQSTCAYGDISRVDNFG